MECFLVTTTFIMKCAWCTICALKVSLSLEVNHAPDLLFLFKDCPSVS